MCYVLQSLELLPTSSSSSTGPVHSGTANLTMWRLTMGMKLALSLGGHFWLGTSSSAVRNRHHSLLNESCSPGIFLFSVLFISIRLKCIYWQWDQAITLSPGRIGFMHLTILSSSSPLQFAWSEAQSVPHLVSNSANRIFPRKFTVIVPALWWICQMALAENEVEGKIN